VARDLARDHRVVIPDRLGYGKTGGRAAGFAVNANAVAKLLGTLDVDRALVVGHSWAGGVALEMVLDFPRYVAGLCLISSVAPEEPVDMLDRALARPVLGTALVAIALGTAGRLLSLGPGRAIAARYLLGKADQQLPELVKAWRRPSTWRSFVTEQRALVDELPTLAPRLGSISVPTTVVVGSNDRVIPPATGQDLAARIPGAILKVVDGAGHLLPQLQPGAVATAVRELVSRSF